MDPEAHGITQHRSTHPKWEQDKKEKSSYGLDRLQKVIWYGPTKMDTTQFQNVQNITWSHKLHRRDHENLESGTDNRRKKQSWNKDPKRYFPRRCTITLTIQNSHDATEQHSPKMCNGYKLSRSQEKINHLMYMDDIKLFAKNERELETLTHAVRIYSQDIGMEFGIEKCAMLVMKSGKWHMTEGMELPNHDRIRPLEEKETCKYLGILVADTIKQVQTKDTKEYLRRTRKLIEIKLSSRNLNKEINTWAVPLVRYSGPFLKWTKEELKQMDQRTRKLMTMHKALHPRDDVDRKEWRRRLASIKDTVDATIQRLEDYIEKHERGLITTIRNDTDNTIDVSDND